MKGLILKCKEIEEDEVSLSLDDRTSGHGMHTILIKPRLNPITIRNFYNS